MTTIATYPHLNVISAITNSYPAILSLVLPVNYVVNEFITIQCPNAYGMTQINGMTGKVMSIDTTLNTVTLNIDTTRFDPFVFAPPFTQLPLTLPSGEIGTLDAATRNNLARSGYVPV